MKKSCVIYLTFIPWLIFFAGWAEAANDNKPYGGRQAAMGNAAVSLYDFWAISHNQAGLARLTRPAGGFYFENRYLVKEMGLGAAAFALPTNSGVFGLSVSYFGYSQYNESKMGLAYARSFGDKLSVGMQFNYMYSFVGGDYNNAAGRVTIEAGMIYEIIPGLSIGAHIFNPTRAKLASVDNLYDEFIPTIFRFGMAYSFSDRVILSLETEKDIEQKPAFKAGIEYQVINQLFIRGGIGTNPTQNAFGFGFHTGSFTIDLSTSFHHILGYSPQASIRFDL
jgi:hypothetical protein